MIDDDSPGRPAGNRPGRPAAPGAPDDTSPRDRRREPVFSAFDEEEDYEESERDTDYASTYEEEDEEYLGSLEDDDPDELDLDWQVLGGAAAAAASGSAREPRTNPWAKDARTDLEEDDRDLDIGDGRRAASAARFDPENDPENEPEDEEDEDADRQFADDEADDDWEDREDYPDDDQDPFEAEPTESSQGWPLGMVIVGLVALVLLAAGGYGVIQQRSAAQEEIRQLQASLATAGSPAELTASREAARVLEERNAEMQATVDSLILENRRLTDTVAGLEAQLDAQQAAAKAAKPPAPAAKPAARPTAAPAPALRPAARPAQPAAAPAATAGGGDWFVNFSSYTQRSVAESWVKRLQPSAGRAVVAAGEKDGRTFYRVRIIGLADRAQAEKVAAQLQSTHKLPPLWVGRE